MAEQKVQLYATWYSPFSNRVEIALKSKGVEYERFEEDLSNKSPQLLQYNPIHKKVPVLVHGTKVIAESHVILEYIDETWDSDAPIMPRYPYERALARFWARFIDEKLFPVIYGGLIRGKEEALEEGLEYMKFLEKELEGKRFFGGEHINFLDIVANGIGYWLGVFEEATGKVILTVDSFPLVCRWRDEFLNCKVVQESLAPKTKFVDLFKHRFENFTAQKSS